MYRLCCLLIAATAMAQHAWPPPGMKCPQRTLVMLEFTPDQAKVQQFYDEHVTWVASAMRAGKIISAGPMADGRTGALLAASSEWNEVEGMLKAEPFVREGLIRVTSHWTWNACEADPGAAAPGK
ncbi:MAG TPA: YciI family protein [Bryobacteraceae bacterium]|nr:YciI family protein [Bryobacteraceae bacterium]